MQLIAGSPDVSTILSFDVVAFDEGDLHLCIRNLKMAFYGFMDVFYQFVRGPGVGVNRMIYARGAYLAVM